MRIAEVIGTVTLSRVHPTLAGYRWIAWEDYAIRDADGRLIEMQSVGRDITDRKHLESELTAARDTAMVRSDTSPRR